MTKPGYTHRELAGRNYLTHMEITYVMIGTDGQQYGPVLLELFRLFRGLQANLQLNAGATGGRV